MKWLAFFSALAALPVAVAVARTRPRLQAFMAALIGLLPFLNIDINLVSDPSYRGDTIGLEVSLVDLVAGALYLALPSRGRLPDRALRVAWLLAALASVPQAPRPVFALYGVVKIVRLFFLGAVAARAVRCGLGPKLLLGLAWGLVYSGGLALWQRYAYGMLQAPGPFAHQNGLGMAVNLIAPTVLALLLSGRGGGFATLTVACAALCVVLALSRGALALFPVACGLVWGGSVLRRLTGRKVALMAVATLAASLLLVKSLDTITERFERAPEGSARSRVLFVRAARRMLEENPLGAGLNQFSWVLAHGGHGESVGLPVLDRDGIVHNIYWLTAAETGWPGLLSYLLVLLAPLLRALSVLRRSFQSTAVRAELSLGMAVSLFVTYAHSQLEWALRMTPVSQLLWLVFGFIAALEEAPAAPGADPAAPPRTPAPCCRWR